MRLRIRATRSFVVLTLSVVFLLAARGAIAAGGVRSAPKAVVPYPSFNFGDVYTGEVISQIFVIKNEGDAELQIKEARGDCGCTVARSDRVVPPGAEGVAEVEVQTISQSGPISKTATLYTNDPEKPLIVLSLVANVLSGAPVRQGKHIGPIFLSPGSDAAIFASPGRKATTELLVTADDAPVKVLSAQSGTKNFVARVEVIEPGRRYKILVESPPIETGGLYKDRLRVVTDNPSLPAFNIALALRVYDKQQ